LEHAVEFFGPGPGRNFGAALYRNVGAGSLTTVLTDLGYPERAVRKTRELLADARRRADPYAICAALFRAAVNHLSLRDSQTAARRAEELLSIAAEHEIPFYLANGSFARAWAMALGE